MFYNSTRNSDVKVKSAEAITQGISTEGGLFVPESIPQLTLDEIKAIGDMKYADRAAYVFSKYLTDFTDAEIHYCTDNAYSTKNFETESISEIAHLFDGTYMLELWHGPTCAFKDMALQILPYFLTTSAKKINLDKKIVILVATSGDTGKAALEGFKDVEGTSILVFYPEDGVSPMQKRQMKTQEGSNVGVCAIKGNFDDCQNGVKAIFTNDDVKKALDEKGMMFSSANSINWGRLVPQIVYYVSSYAELVKDGEIELGEKINIVVPTGNFGNILAAWFAKQMGIPVHKLICASNRNKVLCDFFSSGIYDRNREFFKTTSPSMDILISSNLERLLFEITDKDSQKVTEWMTDLFEKGKYSVDKDTLKSLQRLFVGGFADETGVSKTILEVYDRTDHVIDPHTAVGFNIYGRYHTRSGDESKTVFASTASPFKFAPAVMDALRGAGYSDNKSIPDIIAELAEESGLEIPQSISELPSLEIRHKDVIEKEQMMSMVRKILLD